MKRGRNNKAKRFNNILGRIQTLIVNDDPKTRSISYTITLIAMYKLFKRKDYRKMSKKCFLNWEKQLTHMEGLGIKCSTN